MNEKSIAAPIASQGYAASAEPALGSAGVVSETVGERLKRIYPEYYVRIITTANRNSGPEHTARILGFKADAYEMCLSLMFVWANTPEGRDFWSELSRRERS